MRPRQHRYRSESDRWGRDGERTASRYSPEGSGRRHRTVDYERPSHHHRRGGYRRAGYSRRFQPSPSPSPPRETDIFIEAGRLAAEYLAATGKLSRDAVTGKWCMVDSGENNLSAVDGRASARSGSEKHARDAESGRRRYSDEYDSRDSETFERGRRKFGSSGFAGSNMDKELGKSGSWNERGWSSWDRNVDGDHSSVDHYKQSLEKNGNAGSQNSSPGEITIGGSASLLESDLEKYNPAEGTKSSFSKNKSLPLNVSVKLEIASDDTSGSIKESGEMKTEKEDSLVGVYSGDLVAGNGIANVSTETWSSLSKGPDSFHDFMEEDAHRYDREHSKVPGVDNANDFSMDISTGKLDSATEDKVQMTECGKHPLDDDNVDRDSFKRHREWFPSMDAQFHVSKPDYRLTENLLPARQDPITSESTYADPTNDQKRWNISLIPIGHANSFENLKEKQLFPGSLTCDLNLLGTSEINKNNDVANPSFFNSVVRMGKEDPTVNFGLSMSSNLGLSNKNDKHGLNAKGIEIIDLEDEPAEEDQRFDESKRRIQDDYGLLTLAYSGDGVPHSSSVTTDLNSSQGNMSLPKEEILGIDDSLDISLGKLPSGLPEFWKKPTQDYWKSF